ncbi:unnamed protein product [Phaedon cochleariae]|uniref:glutathione transferase n=1 Tax=Phaedon cochleariae TaxID=80249 RepID=A0A9P0DPC7_PHACE|nr:unnamed protein product [Phaedon cochleariae]
MVRTMDIACFIMLVIWFPSQIIAESSLRLHYFDMPGQGEPIRMMLTYGNIPFEDVRISRDDWPELRPMMPLGRLPVLEVDGVLIPQYVAISRYVATLAKLHGNDAMENLQVDFLIDTLEDLKQKMFSYGFETSEEIRKALEEILKGMVPYVMEGFDQRAKDNGGYIAIKRLTWVDIDFLCAYESLRNILNIDILNTYPNLKEVKNNVLKEPAIEKWIKSRPSSVTLRTYDLKSEYSKSRSEL